MTALQVVLVAILTIVLVLVILAGSIHLAVHRYLKDRKLR